MPNLPENLDIPRGTNQANCPLCPNPCTDRSARHKNIMNSSIKHSAPTSNNPSIRLRPHHLLCLQTFVGHGYSPEFTKHMTYVKSLLDADPHAPITLVNGPDDLCGHCPNCVDNTCTSPKPALFDHLVAQMHSAEPDGHRCDAQRPHGGAYRPVRKSLFHGVLDMSLHRI